MKCSEEIIQLLTSVRDHFDEEDVAVRQRQIRTWRQLKLFWEGFQKTWYSEVAHDWRIWDEVQQDDTNQDYYDKPVNIFRAYLESIIAALSITVPPVKCYPDDADSVLDLQTAKAGDKAAQLLYRHNDVPLLWLHSLFIYCTEGMVACYSYPKSDKSYGTYQEKKYDEVTENHQIGRCPNCGFTLSDSVNPATDAIDDKLKQEKDEFDPDDDDVPIMDYINEHGTEFCPGCGQQVLVHLTEEPVIITRLVGVTEQPKTRICMEAYGGLYIKVPNYARTQADCPYLFYRHETHYVNAIRDYVDPDDADLIEKIKASKGSSPYLYEEWARLSPQYAGEYPINVVTPNVCWFRPCAFDVLPKEDADKLKKKFPNGAKVVFINEDFASAENEALDDCWTLSYNPMSDYVHSDPLGMLLLSTQELTNDLISLITQTIEHGIGQTFVDPETVNLDAYRQLESVPGGMYEAKPKSGKALGDSFYEVKTATLSGEVLPFFQQLQSLSQLVSGALPSLFGGIMQQGGNTAAEYSMSRAQALQRLQNTWKMFIFWWKTVFGKAIPSYFKEMKDDERFVDKTEDGNFFNIFIRRAELEGKIGRVELEANENLPITWNQKKDIVMQLINSGVPETLQILGAPENLPFIRDAIGLEGFFVPGEGDREKQYDEIKQLLASTPITDPATGQEEPSVQVDPDYDNHAIEFEICRKWVISEAGRQAKMDNPNGYKNVLLHGLMHKQLAAPPPQAPAPQPPPEKPKQVPIQGDVNVPS